MEAGETVVLVGPNGSGKSTALEVIAGLRSAENGRIHIAGREVYSHRDGKDLPAWQRPVVLMPPGDSLLPHLTLARNIAFLLPARLRDEAARWSSLLGLTALEHRYPGELSSGQKQRAALARSACRGVPLLLLDEPFAALDVQSRAEARRAVRTMIEHLADAGPPPALLLVTHDFLDAATLAQQILVMENGRVVERGRAADLLNQPRTHFAAELSGLNFVQGTVAAAVESGFEATLFRKDAAITGIAAEALQPGPAAASFAPSAVMLSLCEETGSPRVRLRATVVDLSPDPSGWMVHLAVPFPVRASITAVSALELGIRPGLHLHVAIKSTAVSIYSDRSGSTPES